MSDTAINLPIIDAAVEYQATTKTPARINPVRVRAKGAPMADIEIKLSAVDADAATAEYRTATLKQANAALKQAEREVARIDANNLQRRFVDGLGTTKAKVDAAKTTAVTAANAADTAAADATSAGAVLNTRITNILKAAGYEGYNWRFEIVTGKLIVRAPKIGAVVTEAALE